ncbi:hypothetical protein [Rhodococcus chondri]|uniref:DUF3558 domain-containing protein n=1 Tax=Rhodococcus chondri TaxID=3065941 RepID=A0ABU7JSK0_9NOCA|nr:hypothetical protein [Rhodococcus sp. CC-R104]MEE2033002.1 hypothetical protein [Rhodococcus sp. CC-R104]
MTQHRFVAAALPALACTMLLGSCASDNTVPVVRAERAAASPVAAGAADRLGVLARFTSCEDVAPAIAVYLHGLVPGPANKAGPDRVNCTWEVPAGAAGGTATSSVEVVLEPGTGTVPSPSLAAGPGLVSIPDTAIEAAQGIAYSMSLMTAGTSVIATQIELPDVSVSITGGGRDGQPPLDGPAAVAAAKRLLGL